MEKEKEEREKSADAESSEENAEQGLYEESVSETAQN